MQDNWNSLIHCWWEYKMVQPVWRAICQFLKKLNTHIPYDPAILFLVIYFEEIKKIHMFIKRFAQGYS